MNFTILTITIITIIGAVLRIIGIDKDGGLWNDEYVSWYIASIPFGKGILKAIFSQCHMPFYYFYLKIFNTISSNDTFLRFTSVLPGVASIPVMYMVGKEKTKLTGYMCALFTALSSLLIYYSQEVRFYSILFLFSALSLYFTFRTIKKPRKRNLIGLIISNFLILITHTIGFVYVFFDLMFISYRLRRLYKKFIINTWIITGILFFTVLPLTLKILFFTNSMSQWWNNLNIYRIVQVFCDYFTPIISNVSVIENINGISLNAVFLIVPSLIAIIVISAGIIDKHNRYNNQIILVAISVFVIALFASLLGKLSLNAKYIIEIYPILIFVFCETVDSYNKAWFKGFVFTLFFVFQLGYIISPAYASFLPREEGNKYVADLLKNANLKKGDFIVLTYYPQSRFTKYIDFSNYNITEIDKARFIYYYEPLLSAEKALKDGKTAYRATFLNSLTPVSEFTGSKLINKLNKDVYYNVKPEQKVAFIFLDSVSFLDEYMFQSVVINPQNYKRAPLPYLIFSNMRNEIIKTLPVNARNMRYETKGAWTIVSFQH